MTEQKPNVWPKFIWVLFGFSALLSCAVLVSLCWYGLTGSGFSADFPTLLPGIAAALTLIYTIVNMSSIYPSTYEIFIFDTTQLMLWTAAIVRVALFISDHNALGGCTQVPGAFKSSCNVSQFVLWCGVALLHVSFAKLATAFYVRRTLHKIESQEPDCEKHPPLQSLQDIAPMSNETPVTVELAKS